MLPHVKYSDRISAYFHAVAFTLVDIDGDGQVSKNDLVRYLDLITAAPEGVKLDLVSSSVRPGRLASFDISRATGTPELTS